MELEAARMFGASIAVLPLLGVGLGLGLLFSSLISTIGRNPAVKETVMPVGILAFALTEAIALFALLIAFLILFA